MPTAEAMANRVREISRGLNSITSPLCLSGRGKAHSKGLFNPIPGSHRINYGTNGTIIPACCGGLAVRSMVWKFIARFKTLPPQNIVTCVYIPRKVLQMYSEIWLPDLDSEKWLSSLLSMRLNWKEETRAERVRGRLIVEKVTAALESICMSAPVVYRPSKI